MSSNAVRNGGERKEKRGTEFNALLETFSLSLTVPPSLPPPSTPNNNNKNRLAPRPREAGQAPLRPPDGGPGLPDPGTARGLGDAGGRSLGQREEFSFLVLFLSFLFSPLSFCPPLHHPLPPRNANAWRSKQAPSSSAVLNSSQPRKL